MKTTVSTKYQIVIPKAIRKQLDIRRGQKMDVKASKDGSIVVRKDQNPSYYDFLGIAPPNATDPVERIRKLRENWRSQS